jgi:hypothetical protein
MNECGRVESNHHSRRRPGYSRLSSPVLSVRERGWPAGLEPTPRGSRPRMLPLHHGHHETGTTGFEPAASRATSERSAHLSYAPSKHIAPAGVEPASRAHEARGTAVSPRRNLAGWSRTSGLRFPKPAGCPSSLQPEERVEERSAFRRNERARTLPAPPAGLEPALPG